jgi:hypothetical protein
VVDLTSVSSTGTMYTCYSPTGDVPFYPSNSTVFTMTAGNVDGPMTPNIGVAGCSYAHSI